jgi:electron transfer flavoprotein alpha subunit
MSGCLIYSDREDLGLDLLSWAKAGEAILGSACAAILGDDAEARAGAYVAAGAARVFVNADPELVDLQESVLAEALAQIVEQGDLTSILVGATRRGRALGPRLAQRIGAGCITDAVEMGIEGGQIVAGRYSLGGNTISREKVVTQRQVIIVMPGTVERDVSEGGGGEIVPVQLSLQARRGAVVARTEKPPASVNIADSERIVCVGRGLAKQEDLAMVQELCSALHAELACTRPLSSELGWVPEERMIGISGEKCSPQLLISLGVSGQVQHTVGIGGSNIIVAVNVDPNAPIFKLSDYGIVGDMNEVMPALASALRQRMAN